MLFVIRIRHRRRAADCVAASGLRPRGASFAPAAGAFTLDGSHVPYHLGGVRTVAR